MLDGMFSFVLLDTRDKSYIAARDAIGITPLYMGWGLDGTFLSIFSSLLKKLEKNTIYETYNFICRFGMVCIGNEGLE